LVFVPVRISANKSSEFKWDEIKKIPLKKLVGKCNETFWETK
jgi:hypothetical protein